MTSLVTREDVESVIWQSGIRDLRKVNTIMRVVDVYAMSIRRVYETTKLMEPFGYLAPGESDLGMEVTRCKQCEIPKKFTQYHADKDSPTGHRDICKRCAGPVRKGGIRKCPSCGKPRRSTSFVSAEMCVWCEGKR